ncbi:MAG: hypothetical protein II739_03035 [Clostridia bacterium]|nr:hypothetical protein [Clostridia bacterium]
MRLAQRPRLAAQLRFRPFRIEGHGRDSSRGSHLSARQTPHGGDRWKNQAGSFRGLRLFDRDEFGGSGTDGIHDAACRHFDAVFLSASERRFLRVPEGIGTVERKRMGAREQLPKGYMNAELIGFMKKSFELLTAHPVNKARVARGLKPANSIWPWGEGRRPSLSGFREKYGLSGAVVSAVDLVRGLGICAGMKSIEVEGATGTYKTNFEGKASAAVDYLLGGGDFVYIHMEGPDECGHRHEIPEKILSIEYIDARVVGPVEKALREAGEDFRMLILPDHPTPLVLRTHTHDAVPYIIYDSRQKFMMNPGAKYDENYARLTGIYVSPGHTLMERFIDGGKV